MLEATSRRRAPLQHSRKQAATYMEKNPIRNSMTHIAATLTCRSHTQPYAMTDGGSRSMGTAVLSRRVCEWSATVAHVDHETQTHTSACIMPSFRALTFR